jgi:hypothetical protein
MGILDDAIREHLELKREHGASDDEIKRKEEEVFGSPVAQAAPPAPGVDEHTELLSPEDHEPAVEDLEPLQPAPEDPYAVHPGEDLVPDPEVPEFEERESPRPQQHHHDDEQHPALVDHDHIGGEEHPPEPVFRPSAAAPVEEPPVEIPPLEEPLEDPLEEPEIEDPDVVPGESEGESDGDDEDVLEETPEFLQDAPEHDRLWFEQKPPRDFDFGE